MVHSKRRKANGYDIRAEVEIYGDSITTDITKLNTFPRTQIIPISEMKPILPFNDEFGNVIAEPTSVYASDYNKNLRFQVTTKDGFCFVGPSENCAVQESTASERYGKQNVEYGGQIYSIKLLIDPHSSFESVSIDTIDQIQSDLDVTLVPLKPTMKGPMEEIFEELVEQPIEESIEKPIDEFVPPAFAAEDIDLKIKYRAISEIVTVKSA